MSRINRKDKSNSLYLESAIELYSLGADGNNGYPECFHSFSQFCRENSAKSQG